MSTLYVLEAATMFCGSADPTQSKHLTLQSVKIPSMTEKFEEHHGAGSPVAINIPVGIEAFKVEFKLLGTDPQVLSLFGLHSPYRHDYTILGALRDHQSGIPRELKAVVSGRLAKAEQSEFKRGDLNSMDLEIDGIMLYELSIDRVERLYWNYQTNAWRVHGVDQYAEVNRILRVPQQQN